jgi:hypothetical protein
VDVPAEQVKTESAQDAAVAESVRKKFAEYRPDAVPTTQPAAQTPIVRKDGEESSQAFWNQFVRGAGQWLVEKTTAVFVVKTVVYESVGPKFANQPIIFRDEPVSVADVLSAIERLSGPAGWQLIQRKAGLA